MGVKNWTFMLNASNAYLIVIVDTQMFSYIKKGAERGQKVYVIMTLIFHKQFGNA